jgi:hypothetical protein
LNGFELIGKANNIYLQAVVWNMKTYNKLLITMAAASQGEIATEAAMPLP